MNVDIDRLSIRDQGNIKINITWGGCDIYFDITWGGGVIFFLILPWGVVMVRDVIQRKLHALGQKHGLKASPRAKGCSFSLGTRSGFDI